MPKTFHKAGKGRFMLQLLSPGHGKGQRAFTRIDDVSYQFWVTRIAVQAA
jgi:hypothetical protein